MKNFRLWGAVALLAGLGLTSCGADPTNFGTAPADTVSNKITGSVREWGVDISAGKAEAGEVTFAIANFGSIPHEFIVVKTDFKPGEIPLGADNRFDEAGEGVEAIDEIKEFEVDTSHVLKVNLDAGSYQVLCNIAGHYKNGMYAALEVLEGDGGAKMPAESADGSESQDGDVVSNDITGSVQEWSVGISANEAYSGDVKFTMTNAGSIPHEFIVVKTDYKPGEIPLGANNRFDEEGEGIEAIGEIPEWAVGTTESVTLNLKPGSYQVLCNIEGHYKNGMYKSFTVTDKPAETIPPK
jgi:uncharacterized cupredoxin-like copper-binding protein